MQSPCQELKQEINGLQINYKIAGSGPAILILHGWGASLKSWQGVQEFLAARGYKVIVPDLPGFGESDEPAAGWTIDDYINWLLNFLKKLELGVEQFFLVGHSFGGGIAVKFSNYFPEKVRGLILVAPALRREKTLKYYIALVLAKTGKLIFSFPVLSFFQPLAKKVLYALIGSKDYYKLELEKTVTMKETFKKIVDENLLSCLPKIKIPTLIVWGRKDRTTPLGDAYLINKEIQGSLLEIIPEAGHAISLQAPEKLAEIILNWLKKVGAQSARETFSR